MRIGLEFYHCAAHELLGGTALFCVVLQYNPAHPTRETNMKKALSIAALLGAAASVSAVAQTTSGHWTGPSQQVWRNGFGQCWGGNGQRIAECDPAPAAAPSPAPAPVVVAPPPPPPPAPVQPRVAEAPKPAPAPAPAPAKPRQLTFSANDLFDFNSATLKPNAKLNLDQTVVQPVKGMKSLSFVKVGGHTDRLGTARYNQALSEKRAEAVKAYLVSQGVEGGKIQTAGHGAAQPVVTCNQKARKALIDCLAPNRRVVVEIEGN
jgi:OOP family OmpA-OmpF porin